MDFIGEHLLPGELGHFCAILSFAASLVAMVAYFKSTQAIVPEEKESWKRMARVAFLTDIVGVLMVVGALFFVITNHFYEYFYVWNHSSNEMQSRFLLAGFWESSEGSFLLWTFWNCVLGCVLMNTSGKWEAPVMTILSFTQFCLASMILGIYFFQAKIGSNPFILMREFEVGAPIFSDPHYLQSPTMQDGRGLNPLLQNYWMVIHPPVLFLGFASTIVPFAYALSALWKREYKEWIKPVLPWALFSAAVLGTGVMMGAAWAYESLTFGGFWAWDPVENASLVPWIIMVCGIHTLLAFKHSGHSLRITFAFLILSFLLILYSTFLTRSGILGDTSVHSFTDLGMNTQLALFLFIFVVPALTLFGVRYKQIPTPKDEEAVASREFWMFVGSLLLFLSALYIIGFTSIPVYNKVFGQKVAPPEDIPYAYNKVMILVITVIALLTGITQYLKYKDTTSAFIWRKIGVPTLIALVLGGLILGFGHFDYDKYGMGYLIALYLALFSAIYAVVANAAYLWVGLKGKMKAAGGSVAHVGFGIMLLGILISTSKKKVISENTSGIAVPGLTDAKGKPENPYENLTLIKGMSFRMADYQVAYTGDSLGGPKDAKQYFRMRFTRGANRGSGDAAGGALQEDFTIYPDAFINPKGESDGILANPASKHYLDRDVFVYLTSLPNRSATEDTSTFRDHSLKPGDTLFYSSGLMILNHIIHGTDGRQGIDVGADDSVFTADITVFAKDSTLYKARPTLVIRNGRADEYPDSVTSQSLVLRFAGATAKGITLKVKESNAILDFVTIKAYVFPFINLLWLGTIVMVTGLLMSVVRRVRT
jgi:cytochrome c-type biogenesis protein CcmF